MNQLNTIQRDDLISVDINIQVLTRVIEHLAPLVKSETKANDNAWLFLAMNATKFMDCLLTKIPSLLQLDGASADWVKYRKLANMLVDISIMPHFNVITNPSTFLADCLQVLSCIEKQISDVI